MFNGKSFNEKFLLTRKYYDFAHAINCTCKLTCVCVCASTCDHTRLREQYDLVSLKYITVFLKFVAPLEVSLGVQGPFFTLKLFLNKEKIH